MTSENEITIIDGPAPTFEPANTNWALGLVESANPHHIVVTRLRAINGNALLERCHRAWQHGEPMSLHYRNEAGLETYAPIIAAQKERVPEGDVLVLWIDLDPQRFEIELGPLDDDDWDDTQE